MTFPSKYIETGDSISLIGYPQGKNLSPATISASIKKATSNLPCIHACAASKSFFFKCPNAGLWPQPKRNRKNGVHSLMW
jgi:hypothetical protein